MCSLECRRLGEGHLSGKRAAGRSRGLKAWDVRRRAHGASRDRRWFAKTGAGGSEVRFDFGAREAGFDQIVARAKTRFVAMLGDGLRQSADAGEGVRHGASARPTAQGRLVLRASIGCR